MNTYTKYGLIGTLCISIFSTNYLIKKHINILNSYENHQYSSAYQELETMIHFSSYYRRLASNIIFADAIDEAKKTKIDWSYPTPYEMFSGIWKSKIKDYKHLKLEFQDKNIKKLYEIYKQKEMHENLDFGIPQHNPDSEDKFYEYNFTNDALQIIKQIKHNNIDTLHTMCSLQIAEHYLESFNIMFSKDHLDSFYLEKLNTKANKNQIEQIETKFFEMKNMRFHDLKEKLRYSFKEIKDNQKAYYTYRLSSLLCRIFIVNTITLKNQKKIGSKIYNSTKKQLKELYMLKKSYEKYYEKGKNDPFAEMLFKKADKFAKKYYQEY